MAQPARKRGELPGNVRQQRVRRQFLERGHAARGIVNGSGEFRGAGHQAGSGEAIVRMEGEGSLKLVTARANLKRASVLVGLLKSISPVGDEVIPRFIVIWTRSSAISRDPSSFINSTT